jgi:hypothetical protein
LSAVQVGMLALHISAPCPVGDPLMCRLLLVATSTCQVVLQMYYR